jgi:hypothetical protein
MLSPEPAVKPENEGATLTNFTKVGKLKTGAGEAVQGRRNQV